MNYDPSKPYRERTIDAIRKTWDTPYVTVSLSGYYPVVRKYFLYPEVDHVDGIGTKGYYHWMEGTLRNAVLDSLAMNINDLLISNAVPYKLQDHITVPVEDERVVKLIEYLSDECQKLSIAITGGETSFHDNVGGVDITISVSGFVKSPRHNLFIPGDILVGLASSGLHSNGFTGVRKLFGDELREEFVEPTRMYADAVRSVAPQVNGMVHVTGGAFTRLKVPDVDINIYRKNQAPQDIFTELHERGVCDEDMYRTFNCGTGFILSVGRRNADDVCKRSGGKIIGEVVEGIGNVVIESAFGPNTVLF